MKKTLLCITISAVVILSACQKDEDSSSVSLDNKASNTALSAEQELLKQDEGILEQALKTQDKSKCDAMHSKDTAELCRQRVEQLNQWGQGASKD